MGHDTSNPCLRGARNVYFRLTDPRHADLDRNIRKVESAWARARKLLVGAGGLCHCGNRWGHLMDGVEVMLLDRAPYTARCWDDDRVWINLPLFSVEPDGGVGALVHEFGHRIWFQCLSDKQQAQWTKSWQEAKKRPAPRWEGGCSGTVSGYACTSDLEDFAEVFQAMVLGTIDDYNWKRWVDVCGCGKGSCEAPVRKAAKPSGASANLSRRGAAPIRWKKYPGGVAEIGRTPGGGPYAKSDGGRFVIWVNRFMGPPSSNRSWRHFFIAYDYGLPSGGERFTCVPLGGVDPMNIKQVLAAVERWASERRPSA
jgi:hypothetical protein